MKVWNALFLLSFAVLVLGNNVTLLTDSDFDEFIKENKYVLVDFYASWCEHCRELDPVYEELAGFIKDREIPFIFAKIDANANYNTRIKYDIRSYPTLKAFINGVPSEYKGDTNPQEIIEFIMRKYELVVRKINTKQELREFIGTRGYRSLLISDNPDVINEFKQAALETSTKSKFAITTETLGKELLPDAMPFPSIVVFKDYDERKTVYRPVLGKKRFVKALKDMLIPDISKLTPRLLDHFLKPDSTRKGVVLLHKEGDQQSIENFKKLRKLYPSKELVFLTTTYSKSYEEVIEGQFTLTENDVSALVITYMSKGGLLRYIYKGELEEGKLVEFMKNWEEGKLKPVYKTEEAPEKVEGPVYKLVSKIFHKEVVEDPKDVMVKFYAPWCTYCKKLEPVYKEIAEMFPQIKFVEIDSTKNEVENHPIRGYPTVKLFLAKDKNRPLIVDKMEKQELIKFVKENLGIEPIEKSQEEKPVEEVQEGKPVREVQEEKSVESNENDSIKKDL